MPPVAPEPESHVLHDDRTRFANLLVESSVQEIPLLCQPFSVRLR
jgi:hypothetical protein